MRPNYSVGLAVRCVASLISTNIDDDHLHPKPPPAAFTATHTQSQRSYQPSSTISTPATDMPTAISSLHQGLVTPSQASTPAPSSSATGPPPSRTGRAIHIVIPQTQASVTHAALARTTFTAAAASDEEVLHAEWTPMHGHGAFMVPSAVVNDPPAPPTSARMLRRNSLFFTPSMADCVDAHAELEAADTDSDVGSREMSLAEESEGLELEEQGGNSDDGDRAHTASAESSIDREH